MISKNKILNFLGKHTKNGCGAFMLSYLHNRGRLPNLQNPKDLSELWIRRVLDGKVNDIAWLADKYAVRKYIEEKGLANILIPLLAVYERADQIDFNVLPQKFALKANTGAGMNIICTDKSKLNYDKVRDTICSWLRPGRYSESEQHYNLIPKKVVCEEFIDDGTGGFPIDYKFMCINGQVSCILVCNGRGGGKHAEYLPYSTEWEPLYHYYKGVFSAKGLLPCPANLTDMMNVALKLAGDIDLVRVDLYSNGRQIWFGEMTLTPSGCIFHRWSQKALDDMGNIYRKEK